MQTIILLAVIIAAEGQIPAGSGVQRSEVQQYLNGPGKQLAKQKAQEQAALYRQLVGLYRRGGIDTKQAARIEFRLDGNRVTFKSRDDKTEAIKLVTAQLAAANEAVKNPPPAFPKMWADRMKVGSIGHVRDAAEVLQVVDGKNALVRFAAAHGGEKVLTWLELPSTAKLVDDKAVSFDSVLVEVVGTKRYQAVAGSRTVLHLVARQPGDFTK